MQESLWLQQQPLFQNATLQQDVNCDVCIIGGGMSGIQTAWKLAEAGIRVVLVEAKPAIGLGITGFSTGKITSQHGAKLYTVPLDKAKVYYNANEVAITSFIEKLPADLYQEVTSYIYATTEAGDQKLQQEIACYEQLGIPFFTTKETELPFPVTSAVGINKQYQCDPVAILRYSAQQAVAAGAEIYTNSRATKVYADKIELENGCHVTFQKLFVCTHFPIAAMQKLRVMQLEIYRSYLTASPILDLMKGQYLSVDDSTRTIRTALYNEQPYLLYGGREHRAGTVSNVQPYYDSLTEELRKYFDISQPTFSWSAQDVQTPTKLPFIEQIADRIFIATGYDKWGLSNSLVASELLLHYATEQPHPAAATFQNIGDFSSWTKALQSVGFIGLSFVEGYLTKPNSPACTHLGCKTTWNKAEDTWDCPCHGSRFSADGQVIEGPAVEPLKLDSSQ